MTTRSIEVDQLLPHPPERVWPMLTEPEGLARWWAPGDVAARVGHEFTLDMGPWGHVPCRVLEVVPHERFAFDAMGPGWRDDVLPRLAAAVAT